jgi:hypothetical protein
MNGKGRVSNTGVLELLAKRWQENRPYFPLNERTRGTWLRAACPQPCGHDCLTRTHLRGRGISNSRLRQSARR